MHVTCELPIGLSFYDAANDFQTGRKCHYTGKKISNFVFVFCFSAGRFQNHTEQNVYNSEYALNYTLPKNFIPERKER